MARQERRTNAEAGAMQIMREQAKRLGRIPKAMKEENSMRALLP